jgi:hypothetical protein
MPSNPIGGFDSVYPKGLKRKGNLSPSNFIAEVKNDDGSTSTIRTIGVNFGDGETVIPTVHPDGYIMSDDESIERYKETGESFGTFDTVESAKMYSEQLHKEHELTLKQKQLKQEYNKSK